MCLRERTWSDDINSFEKCPSRPHPAAHPVYRFKYSR